MKTTIGGERLGSGEKQKVSLKTYNRSTHDLSYLWRSSMSAGTLVPFMSEVSLPGDTWNIKLNAEVLTLPTIGPLFGSYKVQLDVFQVPIRLYHRDLHNNTLGIGLDMSQIELPIVRILANNHANYQQTYDDNEHINPSCIFKYLGISGLGNITGATNPAYRWFNAVPYLAYWDIYKQYYANKQEEKGAVIHTTNNGSDISEANLYTGINEDFQGDIYEPNGVNFTPEQYTKLKIVFPSSALEPDESDITLNVNLVETDITTLFTNFSWDDSTKTLTCSNYTGNQAAQDWEVTAQTIAAKGGLGAQIDITEFPLGNIDIMRQSILSDPDILYLTESNADPYGLPLKSIGTNENLKYCTTFSQEGLALKTYQSDLFNNWMLTEWIDGTNGINEITSVSTAGDSFTIDALNLANKVYNMLNRIAISGGTYDDWIDAVYSHDRVKGVESPVYHGSLIKELAFEEVISNAESTDQPLGTLAGRGRLTGKHKGGHINIKTHEPSYIIGIVSITPRIEYSQGNKWDMNIKNMNDFHKPELGAIGFQDLISESMCWTDSDLDSSSGFVTTKSVGKQPAWINYMTNVNRVYGNFADENKEMFMVLNRRYEKSKTDGSIQDLTTYIDPSKFNHIFADTRLDSQNFWVQISNNITARRKMSAKVIPNL